MEKALIAVAAFLVGSIPFGWIFVKLLKRTDIRTIGSGSTGATNVYRACGLLPAVFVFVLDFLKGFLPVYFISPLSGGNTKGVLLQILVGAATILGHSFSVFLKFRGGKGVASSAGVAVVLAPIPLLGAFGVFLVVFALFKVVSAASILATISFAFFCAFFSKKEIAIFAAAVSLLVIFSHRKNILRILRREEKKII